MENRKIKQIVINGETFRIDGDSAYEVAVANGFEGTEAEWLASLKGEKGEKGEKGDTPAMVATRNLANLTFKNAKIDSSTGELVDYNTGTAYASAPEYIDVVGGEKYTFSWVLNDIYSKLYIFEYDKDKTFIKKTNSNNTNEPSQVPFTLTLDSATAFLRIRFENSVNFPPWEDVIPDNFQIETGEEATPYIPPLVIDPALIDFPSNSAQGENGNGIASIEKTGTDGLVDTYTITFTNGDKTTFTVTNGAPCEQEEEIPSYVVDEAEGVIDRVISAQGGRTFTFAAIADLHYGVGGYTKGVDHACYALKYISERIKLDAVAVLGDYTEGYPAEDYENAITDFRNINMALNNLRFAPNFRIQGNHDYYENQASKVHRNIQAYSDNVVWGDIRGGYFYKDFEEYKLRVICVNTIETGNYNARIFCSPEQYQWLASVLDLSAKEDVSEWHILVLSHHPVDWYYNDGSYSLVKILDAYHKGISVSNDYVSCNFAGKNGAKLICNIHGHIHNLLTGNAYESGPWSGATCDVIRISTPEACINRANQYEYWQEETTYSKTIDTADETAFVIYCIDLDTSTIKAICYGAGYDRNISY